MMKLIALMVIALVSAPWTAYAEAQLTKEQKIMGTMLDHYATIAGGWYLEKKCGFMSEELRKEWEGDIESSTVRLNKNLGVSEKMLHQMQAAGKSAAEKKACDEKSRDIVVHTIPMAKKLSTTLTELDQSGEKK